MKWYRDIIVDAPRDLYGFFAFLIVPPGPPFPEDLHNKNMCGIVWSYTGSENDAEEVFKPIKEFPDLQHCMVFTQCRFLLCSKLLMRFVH